MTSSYKLIASLGVIISFLSISVCAQSAGPEMKRFDVDKLSFEYPAEYSLTDESTDQAQQLILTRRGSSVKLAIVATRRLILSNDLPAAIDNSTQPLIKKVALTLGDSKKPVERTSFTTQVGPKEAEGVRLRSSGSTGEVIWLRLGLRLISLSVVSSATDEAAGSQLWQTIRSSLKVEAPILAVMETGAEPTDTTIEGSVLNGRAIALPKPAYPLIARAAHASGTVVVQVLIDEQGNVSAARAVDGNPLLQAVSVAAARQAKFSPTLLEGEPVKVTGVIQYNFVPQ